jgi:hypothetical protein
MVKGMNLTGLKVSYMIGVPSLKALVVGVVYGDQYLLRQEYDTFNERGEWVHVIKQFQRDKWFIDTYHEDQFDDWCAAVDRDRLARFSCTGDDNSGDS